ncbi:MAG: D-alanine--D-alanine ligase [Steroidobacteraceae bacterium]
MKSQRIVVLVHELLVPPDHIDDCTQQEYDEFSTEFDVVQQLEASGHQVRCLGIGDSLVELTEVINEWHPHVVFNLADEFQGIVSFDQHLVSYLEMLRQPYTGCNPRGLLLSRDKALAKRILSSHGIATPAFAVFAKGQRVTLPVGLNFPLFVKSASDDASLGIAQASMVRDLHSLKQRVEFVHQQTGSLALVEEFIAGRELYVGVIGNQRLQAYPVWEMDFGTADVNGVAIATRKAKWDHDYRERHGIDSHAAKDIDPALEKRIKAMALSGYRALSLTGYARMDFRLSAEGKLFLLEANANPCLTSFDDFAKSAAAAGEDYAALLDHIIQLGKRYRIT